MTGCSNTDGSTIAKHFMNSSYELSLLDIWTHMCCQVLPVIFVESLEYWHSEFLVHMLKQKKWWSVVTQLQLDTAAILFSAENCKRFEAVCANWTSVCFITPLNKIPWFILAISYFVKTVSYQFYTLESFTSVYFMLTIWKGLIEWDMKYWWAHESKENWWA